MRERVDALAAYLRQRMGVAPGDRVLLASQNCPQFVTAFYAVLRAGAVVVPVNPMSKASEVRHYAADSGARVAIAAQDLLPALTLGEGDGALRAVLVHAYADAVGAQADGDELPDWVAAPRR